MLWLLWLGIFIYPGGIAMLQRVVKNLIILIIAPILAVVIFYATRDLSWLSASVLDILEMQTIKESWRGLAYKTTNQTFEVFWSDVARTMDTVGFRIIYNQDQLVLLSGWDYREDFDSWNKKWELTIRLPNPASLPLEGQWFQLAFSGEAKDILLAEAWGSKNNVEIPLAVGNLNIWKEHTSLP